jgi:hypothetical protein
LQHSGSEHGITATSQERVDQVFNYFRRILPIGMEKYNYVQAVLNGRFVGRFLVSSIAEILWPSDDRKGEACLALVLLADRVCAVAARVIADQHFRYSGSEGLGNPIEYGRQG